MTRIRAARTAEPPTVRTRPAVVVAIRTGCGHASGSAIDPGQSSGYTDYRLSAGNDFENQGPGTGPRCADQPRTRRRQLPPAVPIPQRGLRGAHRRRRILAIDGDDLVWQMRLAPGQTWHCELD